MAKQGQHKHDRHDHRLMPAVGHNNPRKTTRYTTGTASTRRRHARHTSEHEQPARQHEMPAIRWNPDTRRFITHKADSRAREEDREPRSGSDSNADAGSRGY
jgi:hypothetical protein